MLKLTILTVLPEYTEGLLKAPVIERAVKKGAVTIEVVDIRAFAGGSFRHIDDSPFGGGKGMILRAQPVLDALKTVRTEGARTVLLSPKGKVYDREKAHEYAKLDHLVLICGHFEGLDARIEKHADELLSIGDYVLTGGELAAAAVADSVIRLLPDVLKEGVTADESHENGLLEYPQYTQPADMDGDRVPAVLLSGDHGKIAKWRRLSALLETMKYRPDLFSKLTLNDKERQELEKFMRETEV